MYIRSHALSSSNLQPYSTFSIAVPPPSPSVLRYYKDCDDAYSNGHKDSTVYLIQPDQQPPFEVYCEMDTEGKRGWTVIQRRQQGNENFDRGWSEYREGFGDLNGEFWLGLEKIYRLTASAQDTLLQVNMTDFEGGKVFAAYSHFSLGPGTTEYKLVVSGYNGTAGDTLNEVNNAPFSSKDNDNDFSTSLSVNCAAEWRGGWWYRGNSCGTSNLNGEYLAGRHGSSRRGIYWHYFKGSNYSLKTSQMMLLRKY